jgi:hypothetical protein
LPEIDIHKQHDPSLLDPADLLIHIPTVGNGIDFSIDKASLDQFNQSKNDTSIELNLLNAFKLTENGSDIEQEIEHPSQSIDENIEIIKPQKDIQEVFSNGH